MHIISHADMTISHDVKMTKDKLHLCTAPLHRIHYTHHLPINPTKLTDKLRENITIPHNLTQKHIIAELREIGYLHIKLSTYWQ